MTALPTAPLASPAAVRRLSLHVGRRLDNNHLVPLLGHHRVARLQPEHLEAAWRAIREHGLSPATVLLNHRLLSRALKVALQCGVTARNVATLVDGPQCGAFGGRAAGQLGGGGGPNVCVTRAPTLRCGDGRAWRRGSAT